jgi:hypothetical protein
LVNREIKQLNRNQEQIMEINTSESKASGMLEISVSEASEVDEALTKAIEAVQKAATEHRTGILVTRIDAGRYIVRAHPAVPFGLVRQRHTPTGK